MGKWESTGKRVGNLFIKKRLIPKTGILVCIFFLWENIRQIDIIEMQGKSIEISLGACFYDGYEEVSFDQLYRKADRAMYQSKKQKGCSAVIYGEEMSNSIRMQPGQL